MNAERFRLNEIMAVTSMISIMPVLAFSVGAASAGDWEHQLTPYAWAVGQKGDTGVRNTVVGDLIADYDLSPSDILDRLDGAFLFAYRAEKNKTWGLTADVVYMDLTDDGAVGPFEIDVDASQLLISVAYTRAIRKESPWWWFGGGRWIDLDNKITFQGTGPIGIGATVRPSESWFDPYAGLHYRRELSTRWHLGVMAEAGGFGVGSDLSYQGMAEAAFDINDLLQLRFGYRLLDADYDDNDFVFDTTSQGVIIGLTFKL